MRVLFLSSEMPFPPTNGHCLHLASLIRVLASEGHEVSLISLVDQDAMEADSLEAQQLCQEVDLISWFPSTTASGDYLRRLRGLVSTWPYAALRFASTEFTASVRRHLDRGGFDVVICDMIYLLPHLPRDVSTPVIVDTLGIAHVLFARYLPRLRNPLKRLYVWTECQKMRRWEIDWCSRATAVAACSETERLAFERLSPGVPVVLLPNVVDVDRYVPATEPPERERETLLYTGGMDWYPNQDAVEFFSYEVLPRIRERLPKAKFRVGGRRPSARLLRRYADMDWIEFTGSLPDMRDEIKRATLCVVPLRIATGTRIKILEAGALERAVVSTRLGAEGLNFKEGKEIVLADDPAAFAEAVVELLTDPARRQEVGRAARRRVEESYSVPALRSATRAALARVAGSRQDTGRASLAIARECQEN